MHSQGMGGQNNRNDQYVYPQGGGPYGQPQQSPGNFPYGANPAPSPQNKQYTISQQPPPMESPNLSMRSPHSPRQSPQGNNPEFNPVRYQQQYRDSPQYNGNSVDSKPSIHSSSYGQGANQNQASNNFQYEPQQQPQQPQQHYQQFPHNMGSRETNIPRNLYGNGPNGQSAPGGGQFQTQMAPSTSQTGYSQNVAAEVSLTDQGTRLKLMGNLDGAMSKYIEASEINQNYAPAYYNIGVM